MEKVVSGKGGASIYIYIYIYVYTHTYRIVNDKQILTQAQQANFLIHWFWCVPHILVRDINSTCF